MEPRRIDGYHDESARQKELAKQKKIDDAWKPEPFINSLEISDLEKGKKIEKLILSKAGAENLVYELVENLGRGNRGLEQLAILNGEMFDLDSGGIHTLENIARKEGNIYIDDREVIKESLLAWQQIDPSNTEARQAAVKEIVRHLHL